MSRGCQNVAKWRYTVEAVTEVLVDEIEDAFEDTVDPEYHVLHVDRIFRRVGLGELGGLLQSQ